MLNAGFTIIRPGNVVLTMTVTWVMLAWFGGTGPFETVAAMLCTGLVAAFGYIVNDLYDLETDRINRPKRPLPSGALSVGGATRLAAVLAFLGLLVSIRINVSAQAIAGGTLVLLFLYAAKLKGVPLVGHLLVSVTAALVVVFSAVAVGNFDNWHFPVIFILLIQFARELVKALEDREGDSAAGLRTAATEWPETLVRGLVLVALAGLASALLYVWMESLFRIGFHYISAALILPSILYSAILLLRSTTTSDYHRLSLFLKGIMALGLVALGLGKPYV